MKGGICCLRSVDVLRKRGPVIGLLQGTAGCLHANLDTVQLHQCGHGLGRVLLHLLNLPADNMPRRVQEIRQMDPTGDTGTVVMVFVIGL